MVIDIIKPYPMVLVFKVKHWCIETPHWKSGLSLKEVRKKVHGKVNIGLLHQVQQPGLL